MTNEQLLLQIGRMVGEAMQESEGRMKLYVQDIVQASEERLSKQICEVKVSLEETNDRLTETDKRLTRAIESLHATVRHAMDDTEKMARQIVATVERIERIEGASVRAEI